MRDRVAKDNSLKTEPGLRKRETLKPGVPCVTDEDIADLCKKYPKQTTEEDEGNNVNEAGQLKGT